MVLLGAGGWWLQTASVAANRAATVNATMPAERFLLTAADNQAYRNLMAQVASNPAEILSYAGESNQTISPCAGSTVGFCANNPVQVTVSSVVVSAADVPKSGAIQVVEGGGAQRLLKNVQNAQTSNVNGAPATNTVTLQITAQVSGNKGIPVPASLESLVSIEVINATPPQMQVLSRRDGFSSKNGIAYIDDLCNGNIAGCTGNNVNGDTTLITAVNKCQPTPGLIASPCAPIGGASPTPEPLTITATPSSETDGAYATPQP